MMWILISECSGYTVPEHAWPEQTDKTARDRRDRDMNWPTLTALLHHLAPKHTLLPIYFFLKFCFNCMHMCACERGHT